MWALIDLVTVKRCCCSSEGCGLRASFNWINSFKSNGMYADMYVVKKISIFYFSLGYRPRRTLKFALWDASKYGHVGSFEWVQVFQFTNKMYKTKHWVLKYYFANILRNLRIRYKNSLMSWELFLRWVVWPMGLFFLISYWAGKPCKDCLLRSLPV